jgi:hypothetical protein
LFDSRTTSDLACGAADEFALDDLDLMREISSSSAISVFVRPSAASRLTSATSIDGLPPL